MITLDRDLCCFCEKPDTDWTQVRRSGKELEEEARVTLLLIATAKIEDCKQNCCSSGLKMMNTLITESAENNNYLGQGFMLIM
jgi:hypothetical protein